MKQPRPYGIKVSDEDWNSLNDEQRWALIQNYRAQREARRQTQPEDPNPCPHCNGTGTALIMNSGL